MESISGRIREACPFRRAWITLGSVLLFLSAEHPTSRALAQAECGVAISTPFLVDSETGVDTLRAAANCTGGGSLATDWAGAITLDSPISIASGVFLSISGEGALAEVHGGNQTRMFEVSLGGGLTLTQLTLSGGNETNGGAVYSNSAALILDSCIFHDNVATDGDGGAVWAKGGNVTIIGGHFLGNKASGHGGAVAATGAIQRLVVQEGSIFKDNEASSGGALYCSGVAESSSATSCSLSDTEFTSNTATLEYDGGKGFDFSEGVDGGGAVVFLIANANITDSVFSGNHAQHSGGALLGGYGTDITVNGCTFETNTAEMFGGAIAAASMTLGGSTQLTNNTATLSGGAVLGWYSDGTITFHDVACTRNTAAEDGGCFYGAGGGMFNNGTVMHDNEALNGGCLHADNSEFHVSGGEFTCRSLGRGGFYHAFGDNHLTITGGLIANNEGGRKGGAISCSVSSTLTIEGGTFENNTALELGGVIQASGESSSVNISGGMFRNNTATFFGGSVYLDSVASFTCEGATFRDNYAGDQGGGIYAKNSAVVRSSCDLIANLSPQGAALYMANAKNATFENHVIADNVAYSGSVVYMTSSTVVARGVTFESDVDLQEDSANRAVQSDHKSTLTLNECVFDGWRGDTVIYHKNAEPDSLLVDSCDFSRSSSITAVSSLNSDAKVRNAVVGDLTFANKGRHNNSLPLVNRAMDCSNHTICGPGECVDSALGVLCECLDVDTCLHDGGEVFLEVKHFPANETVSPQAVSFELVVSSAGNGTTHAIWNLEFEIEDLTLDVVPSSGVLPLGGHVTIVVTGTAAAQDVGGNLTSRFNLTRVGSASSTSTAGVALEVGSVYYLCSAFKYAEPLAGDVNGISCEPCISIGDGQGVNCTSPGATLASLPIQQGYWRSGLASLEVHKCGHAGACIGATEVSDADDYCANGYRGPYCAVCSEGYGRGVSNDCHSCDNVKARVLTWTGIIASAGLLLLFVILGVVFLIGGLDAVDIVRNSVFKSRKASKVWSVSKTSGNERHYRNKGASKEFLNDIIAPAIDFSWESQRCPSDRDTRPCTGESPWSSPGSDSAGRACFQPSSTIAGAGTSVELSPVPAGHASIDVEMSASHCVRKSPVAGAAVDGALVNARGRSKTNDGRKSQCCGISVSIKTWTSRLPLHKFKIPLVVWQILTVFSSITGVKFPESYSMFLSWVDFVNFDIGHVFSASCVLPSVNFYARLLVTTLMPLVLATGLVVTYQVAKRRAGIGSAGVVARRSAWSRHVAAGLLLTFLVFTSASTSVFKTFACDDAVGDGKSYLRADYSLSCGSSQHTFFKGYAMFMILVYPIGIPALYAAILWSKREFLNPCVRTAVKPEPDATDGAAMTADSADGADGAVISFWFVRTVRECLTKNELSLQELQEFNGRVRARTKHPELVPSMFLWKDFGPELFYYEVLECGRRMLLTGVLIFISPNTSIQVAAACFFAFGSLVAFELLRPHQDPTDEWLYRLGGVVIFLSYFLVLLIKVDAAGEDGRSALAILLVVINVILVLTVVLACWLTVQQTADSSRDEENTTALAITIETAEQDAISTPGSKVMEAL